MRDHDFLRVIGATILAAGVAVMSQDPSLRLLPPTAQTPLFQSHAQELMLLLKDDPSGEKARQFRQDLRQQWANFTDDDLADIDGNSDRFLEKIHLRYGDRREELKQWVIDWFDGSAQQNTPHG